MTFNLYKSDPWGTKWCPSFSPYWCQPSRVEGPARCLLTLSSQSSQSHGSVVLLKSLWTIVVFALPGLRSLGRLLKLPNPLPTPPQGPECWMRWQPTDCPPLSSQGQRAHETHVGLHQCLQALKAQGLFSSHSWHELGKSSLHSCTFLKSLYSFFPNALH